MAEDGGEWLAIMTSLPFDLVANGNIDWRGLGIDIFFSPSGMEKLWSVTGFTDDQTASRDTGGARMAPEKRLAYLAANGWAVSAVFAHIWLVASASVYHILDMRGKGLTYVSWNVSIFPWGVPLGLWMVSKTWQECDEFDGVSATLLLSPYYSPCTPTIWF